MELRKLGGTNIEITPIGLGCWQFSQRKGLVGRYWEALADRQVREILEVTVGSGVNWLDTAEGLREVAGRHGVSPAQAALNWLIHAHGDTVVAIPGASRREHAAQNVGALGFRLSEEEMNHLARLSGRPLAVPV